MNVYTVDIHVDITSLHFHLSDLFLLLFHDCIVKAAIVALCVSSNGNSLRSELLPFVLTMCAGCCRCTCKYKRGDVCRIRLNHIEVQPPLSQSGLPGSPFTWGGRFSPPQCVCVRLYLRQLAKSDKLKKGTQRARTH